MAATVLDTRARARARRARAACGARSATGPCRPSRPGHRLPADPDRGDVRFQLQPPRLRSGDGSSTTSGTASARRLAPSLRLAGPARGDRRSASSIAFSRPSSRPSWARSSAWRSPATVPRPGRDQQPDLPADGDARGGHGRQPPDPLRSHRAAAAPSRASSRPLYPAGFLTILIAHIMFNISYVVVTVKARLAGFDRRLEEAAMDLGANEWTTFWRVTFPLIFPGIMAAALLAFSPVDRRLRHHELRVGHDQHVPHLGLHAPEERPAGAGQRDRLDHLPRAPSASSRYRPSSAAAATGAERRAERPGRP